MKNRFIQMFLVICAVMLIICTASVWAAAEDVTATPTDLMPVEPAGSVSETEMSDEEVADCVEIIITKAVRIGDSWSGAMKKTKPAVLKLDIDHAQEVNLVVLGRHAWITVEKSDQLSENPVRTLTDDETSQTVISWYAEAGSYLITIGPVEPNLMAKVNITFMDAASYENWLTEQEEQTEELAEETEKQPDETEEPAEENEEQIEEEINTTEETTDESIEENIPESEYKPERHITVDVTWDVPDPVIGDTAHFEAILDGYDELQYTMQWQYSPDETTWHDIPNETNTTMDVVVTPENNIVYWRILVYVEDNQED
ncbi:hypothetical protein [Aristaeella hokkaidonensis]|uniref:Uncharacterized protein n=1 Tax=Aristaeella hokkaidonensis TaxID=3046382 RepID=A0AC61N3H9_9FIRM|nr:hypothetical protein [Aristaeella hokkaidonensis]QUC67425.1 hypothetical protein JYE49_01605 [Aristaeella hokkaidonensis]SNT93234.1 hypothetical protein SAMN06297421_1022 [Aristaeella hokkaidonensis]